MTWIPIRIDFVEPGTQCHRIADNGREHGFKTSTATILLDERNGVEYPFGPVCAQYMVGENLCFETSQILRPETSHLKKLKVTMAVVGAVVHEGEVILMRRNLGPSLNAILCCAWTELPAFLEFNLASDMPRWKKSTPNFYKPANSRMILSDGFVA